MQKICRNCNQVNPPEAMFCRQCAASLDTPPAQQQYTPPPPQYQNQQQWNQPNFGNQGMQPPNFAQTGAPKSNRAMISAILAVLALFCCGFLTGIPAAIMGWLEIQAIKEGKAPADGMMMAQVGLWLGIAGTIINAILNIIGFILLSLGGRGY
jgi:hypothetical protein